METDFTLTRSTRRRSSIALWLVLCVVSMVTSGCALVGTQSQWNPPAPYAAAAFWSSTDATLAEADAQLAAGQQAEAAGDAAAIDHYFAAATQAWPYHAACAAPGPPVDHRATALYQSAVRSFLEAATRFDRFDRFRGVALANGQLVPVTYRGFVWQPCDFAEFLPVGFYESPKLPHRYASSGVGVPYVVLTPRPPRYAFTRAAQPFAATAVVAPSVSSGGGFAVEFYDPLRASATDAGLPIARDLTAPLAYAQSHESDAWLMDFLRPDRGDPLDGLHMREPFQPGKIPVVFVHGLASDPLTWTTLENELRNKPAVFSRYQFWFFRYDTGDPFLSSAALLRRQLAQLRQVYDPMRIDPNLSRMVVVGHSMGGLVAKMQVTYSGERIWNAAATRPFNTIVTDATTRADLANAFFFAPSPDIRRVIYIATPHRGSSQATRCIGRLSSALIEERPDLVARHAQLVRDNPGTFRDELRRRVPTSVDLLEPQSCFLQATNALAYSPCVTLHSIIGEAECSLLEGPSDGVVAVSSARIAGVQSELLVDARHTEVQRNPETVNEIICILQRHAVLDW